jgi:hypothetical protein
MRKFCYFKFQYLFPGLKNVVKKQIEAVPLSLDNYVVVLRHASQLKDNVIIPLVNCTFFSPGDLFFVWQNKFFGTLSPGLPVYG